MADAATTRPASGRGSLRPRAFALVLATAVLPLLVVTGLQVRQERQALRGANVEVLRTRTDEVAHAIFDLRQRRGALHDERCLP